MYVDTEGYFGQASGIPYSRLHELRGRDITNFQDKIERLRRAGIPPLAKARMGCIRDGL